MTIKVTEQEMKQLQRLAEAGVDYSAEFSPDGLVSDGLQLLAKLISRCCVVDNNNEKSEVPPLKPIIPHTVKGGQSDPTEIPDQVLEIHGNRKHNAPRIGRVTDEASLMGRIGEALVNVQIKQPFDSKSDQLDLLQVIGILEKFVEVLKKEKTKMDNETR